MGCFYIKRDIEPERVCMYVCIRARERERKKKREREREFD